MKAQAARIADTLSETLALRRERATEIADQIVARCLGGVRGEPTSLDEVLEQTLAPEKEAIETRARKLASYKVALLLELFENRLDNLPATSLRARRCRPPTRMDSARTGPALALR